MEKEKSNKPVYSGNSIMVRPNGPLICKGETEITLQSADEELILKDKEFALCRCGLSDNKPFCVGAHGQIGFSDRKETDGHFDKRENYICREVTIHDNRGICSHVGFLY